VAKPLLGRWTASPAALVAGIAATVILAGYLAIIQKQDMGFPSRVVFVAGWIAVAAVLAFRAAFTRAPRRRSLFSGIATAMLIVLSVPAALSIGVAVFLIALLAGSSASVAAHESGIGPLARIVWLVALLAGMGLLLAVGFQLTEPG
jgi:uncharacterized membrane protein YozB (DUF420 family)